MEGKNVNIPVASHGLHRHDIATPTLATHNFFDYFPVYNAEYLKGEKSDFGVNLFGRTNPLNQAAFMTGKYVIRKFFVPYYTIFKGYYNYYSRTQHVYSDGKAFGQVGTSRFCTMLQLSQAFAEAGTDYATSLVDIVGTPNPNEYDYSFKNGATVTYYRFGGSGRAVYRILRSMGYAPTWNSSDGRIVDVMPLLCYIKAYLDWIAPVQYLNDVIYKDIEKVLYADDPTNLQVDAVWLVRALYVCSLGVYDDSIFDFAFDNPVAGTFDDVITFPDVTGALGSAVTNQGLNNGTPVISVARNQVSQYQIDALQSINNFVNRHRLSGSRLIDNFKSQRGLDLSAAVANRSLWLGEDVVNLKVGDVENNAGGTNGQDMLGELAGKGIVDNNDVEIRVKNEYSEDGQLIIMMCAIPDAPMQLFNDPKIFHTDSYDRYHDEFDKLGPEAIPQNVIYTSMNGSVNESSLGATFGFLNRYYGQVLNMGRLIGDFNLNSRGAETLQQYHSFRMFDDSQVGNIYHNLYFLLTSGWKTQYQRFFNSEDADNLITCLWFVGDTYNYKLPLGDSYDWDDDEFNRKVDLVLSGSPK